MESINGKRKITSSVAVLAVWRTGYWIFGFCENYWKCPYFYRIVLKCQPRHHFSQLPKSGSQISIFRFPPKTCIDASGRSRRVFNLKYADSPESLTHESSVLSFSKTFVCNNIYRMNSILNELGILQDKKENSLLNNLTRPPPKEPRNMMPHTTASKIFAVEQADLLHLPNDDGYR